MEQEKKINLSKVGMLGPVSPERKPEIGEVSIVTCSHETREDLIFDNLLFTRENWTKAGYVNVFTRYDEIEADTHSESYIEGTSCFIYKAPGTKTENRVNSEQLNPAVYSDVVGKVFSNIPLPQRLSLLSIFILICLITTHSLIFKKINYKVEMKESPRNRRNTKKCKGKQKKKMKRKKETELSRVEISADNKRAIYYDLFKNSLYRKLFSHTSIPTLDEDIVPTSVPVCCDERSHQLSNIKVEKNIKADTSRKISNESEKRNQNKIAQSSHLEIAKLNEKVRKQPPVAANDLNGKFDQKISEACQLPSRSDALDKDLPGDSQIISSYTADGVQNDIPNFSESDHSMPKRAESSLCLDSIIPCTSITDQEKEVILLENEKETLKEVSHVIFDKSDEDQKITKRFYATIGVDGMVCGGCVSTTRNALEAVPGILSVDVSLKQQTAVIEYGEDKTISNKGRLKMQVVLEAIKSVGMSSFILPNKTHDEEAASSKPIVNTSVFAENGQENESETPLSLMDQLRLGSVRRYRCACGSRDCICSSAPIHSTDKGRMFSLGDLCARLEDSLGAIGEPKFKRSAKDLEIEIRAGGGSRELRQQVSKLPMPCSCSSIQCASKSL